MPDGPTPLQRSLMTRAAVLFFLGILTGAWAGVVLTQGKALMIPNFPKMEHERLALAAHLNGLLGCFWILGVAWTIEHTRFGESGKTWLARLVTLSNYANWSVTVVASILDRDGLSFAGDARNTFVAALLMGLVVLPSIATSALWAYGLLGKPPASAV
ncbi:hypothetical protein HY251_18865 [bacterium]|nr:hypothetical protein [bacterium]